MKRSMFVMAFGGFCLLAMANGSCGKEGPPEDCETDSRDPEERAKEICCPATYEDGNQKLVSIYVSDPSKTPEGPYTFEDSCHPCVAEVCKLQPKCCEDSWTWGKEDFFNTCAQVAEQVCPRNCDESICCPFVGGYGQRSVFVEHFDGHFEAICHPWVAQVCEAWPECCTTVWGEECTHALKGIKWATEHPCGGKATCATGVAYTDAASAVQACASCPDASLQCNGKGAPNVCYSCDYAIQDWEADQAKGTCGDFCYLFTSGGTCVMK